MNELIRNAPRIIESASKSPLGIFALAILVVATVGYLFFRNENLRIRAVIYFTMAGGLVAYGIATTRAATLVTKHPEHLDVKPLQPEVVYAGRVIDRNTHSTIQDAKVEVDISGVSPAHTDSNGQYRIQTSHAFEGNRVRVTADEYQPYDEILSLESSGRFADIRLTRVTKVKPPISSVRPRTSIVLTRLWGTVTDEQTFSSVQGAAVTLTVGEEEPITHYTDSRGSYVFDRVPSDAFGHIRVTAANYRAYERHFSPRNRSELKDIRLERQSSP